MFFQSQHIALAKLLYISLFLPRENFVSIFVSVAIVATAQLHSITKKHNTSIRRRFDVDITSIRRQENIDKFHVILTYFFNLISMGKKFTSIRLTFFDVISMGKKSTSF